MLASGLKRLGGIDNEAHPLLHSLGVSCVCVSSMPVCVLCVSLFRLPCVCMLFVRPFSHQPISTRAWPHRIILLLVPLCACVSSVCACVCVCPVCVPADLHSELGHGKEASEMFARSLAGRSAVLGPTHLDTLYTQVSRAHTSVCCFVPLVCHPAVRAAVDELPLPPACCRW